MKRILFLLCFISVTVVLLSSCKSFMPSRMLKTPSDYNFAQFDTVQKRGEYILAVNDRIKFIVYARQGESIINYLANSEGNTANRSTLQDGLELLIEYDGTVNFPHLKRVHLAGMTLREAEEYLEGRFADYLVDPMVQLSVINNRVVIFPGGDGGDAKVIYLKNPNTTLFEALAESGGIKDGRANKIKLIRGDLSNPSIYKIDLSTVKGLEAANLTLQANDIIYVEPRSHVGSRILVEITPYITMLSTVLLIVNLFKK